MIDIAVIEADAWDHGTDVLALVTAQAFLGKNAFVSRHKAAVGLRERLHEQEIVLEESHGTVAAPYIVFVNMGYDEIVQAAYRPIRDFGRKVLSFLGTNLPEARSVSFTTQGVWQGLDEIEAFEAVLAGLVDATTHREFPQHLERVDFCERNQRRANRLQIALSQLFPGGRLPIPGQSEAPEIQESTKARLRSAGYESLAKPHVFVAMPFSDDIEDVYHYGIQSAVHPCGFVCERADFSSFTGEAMAWIRQRIATASLVIADLTTANGNVYLEVGYAWGRDRPTILLARNGTDLLFDVRGHRCLFYTRIKDLEETLKQELISLNATSPT